MRTGFGISELRLGVASRYEFSRLDYSVIFQLQTKTTTRAPSLRHEISPDEQADLLARRQLDDLRLVSPYLDGVLVSCRAVCGTTVNSSVPRVGNHILPVLTAEAYFFRRSIFQYKRDSCG